MCTIGAGSKVKCVLRRSYSVQQEYLVYCYSSHLAEFPCVNSDLDVVVDQSHEARERICRNKQGHVTELASAQGQGRDEGRKFGRNIAIILSILFL